MARRKVSLEEYLRRTDPRRGYGLARDYTEDPRRIATPTQRAALVRARRKRAFAQGRRYA